MGLKIITDDRGVKIYRHEKTSAAGNPYVSYSMAVASKDKDGNWVNGFIDCTFKKGVEVNHKSVINIKNAFYTCSKYNDKVYVKVMITDFYVVDEGEKPVAQGGIEVDPDGFMAIPDGIPDELPFV